MKRAVFILGSHPALSAAEVAAYAERGKIHATWDLSRLPVALFAEGDFPAPAEAQAQLGGTTMIGTLRATFEALPSAEQILGVVPEILAPRQGKRLVGVSALALNPNAVRGSGLPFPDLSAAMRTLAMELKRAIGMKGTRVVFPPAPRSPVKERGSLRGGVGPARRSDLSTAQLFHNRLPKDGTAIFFLVGPGRVDLATVDAIQDIEAYARRDRGRPQADPGTGMLPPKVAQMLLNLSLVPPGGTVYDPFCGVGTIPMEALLLGLKVIASDVSPTQVERTKENLAWLRRTFPMPQGPSPMPNAQIFVYDVARGKSALPDGSVDAVVTEGWLGPARSRSPLPREAEEVFKKVARLLQSLFSFTRTVVRQDGRLLITVPAFRIGKRTVRFPLESVRAAGFLRDPLVPKEWIHPLFREASSGTLLYGRPDAIVLREVLRLRRVVKSASLV